MEPRISEHVYRATKGDWRSGTPRIVRVYNMYGSGRAGKFLSLSIIFSSRYSRCPDPFFVYSQRVTWRPHAFSRVSGQKTSKNPQDLVSIQSTGLRSRSAEQPHWPRTNMSFKFSLGFCKRV